MEGEVLRAVLNARDDVCLPSEAVRELLRAAYHAGHTRGSGYDGEMPREAIDWDFEEWITNAQTA